MVIDELVLSSCNVKILRRKPVGSLFNPDFSLMRSSESFTTTTAIHRTNRTRVMR
ncbi:uncharacterized protein LACBIDRAFT_309824 [Laccaria bicolor S238N-H82]|uniref:Predicted protein n=1 Tax=Laccaria bicolor (strain S238N-H82 / ATCC MYA-4686) TaxID=486041 RepID=B0DT53_LACBS|nr:uncharacterized protein LACBIDRAFT_309824 [Laccaria bicolor S238N-H82]EDR02160.1 predicted protein [Laccaria bicolor S238N-H82]|eukprot:XP_001887105.1 predicted protein [Laccaria bicolor S238N-H82]